MGLLRSIALVCLIALLLVAEDEAGGIALHFGGEAVQHHDQVARLGQEAAQLIEAGIGEVADRPAVFCQHRPQRFGAARSEEHTTELQSLMRISYAALCLTKNTQDNRRIT